MNKLLFLLLSLMFSLFSIIEIKAQEFPLLHHTIEDGLPSNNVYSVYRDSKGYIWLSTDKGVARYNGLKFEIFSTFNGLPDNEIFFVREDSDGRIWLGTFNGELCFYKNDTFHTAANTPFLRLPYKEPHIRYVSIEADNSIIVSYNNTLRFLSIKGESCKAFDLGQMKDAAVRYSAMFAKKISDNKYKLICKDKVVYIDTLYHVLGTEKIDDRLINNGSFTSCQNRDYIYNDSCFYTMDMQVVKKCKSRLLKPSLLHELYLSGSDVYYATINGLFINDTLNILKGNNISGITQDNKGNYWMSTLNNGVFVLKGDYRNSKYYSSAYKGVAKYAYARNGNVFFATADNNLFGLKNNNVSCIFNYKAFRRGHYDYPVDFGFLIDSNYKYYNNYNDDVVVIDNLLSPKIYFKESVRFSGTKELFLSGDRLYLKLPKAIDRIEFTEFGNNDVARNDIGKNADFDRIFCAAKAPDNSIWYATISNIFRVDNSQDDGVPQIQFKGISLKHFGFFGKYLVGYTHDNQLLVCSNINDAKIAVDSITPRKCIWDKFYGIDSLHILISTNNLYRLLTIDAGGSKEKITVKSIENPFLPLHAEVICSDGVNWFFFKDGAITVIDRNSLLGKSKPPTLFFTSQRTVDKVYHAGNDLQLSYTESRSITLSFSLLSFSGKDVQCQYSVSKDVVDNWRDVKGEEINLINPGFGDYTVKLKAKTISSDYSEPIIFTLHILRPFWLTWWFLTLVCISITLMIGVVTRYRFLYLLRKKGKEHEAEMKFMKLEFKALNALMNPHFIFNTLNNVQGLVNRNDKLAANEYIRIFADLIRQNMHNISKELIPLQKEIALVSNYLLLEKLRFKEHLNYKIDVADGLDISEILVPPLLVQPLVENSIKHGILPLEAGNGFIHINIYERSDTLYIEVKDNGVGMNAGKDENTMHESFGLDNVRKRIEQLGVIQNKQILFSVLEKKDSNGKQQWTIVRISIPISTDE